MKKLKFTKVIFDTHTHTYVNINDLYSTIVRLIFFKCKKYLDVINVF